MPARHATRSAVLEAGMVLAQVIGCGVSLSLGVVVLYLAKSALGINIFPGHAPLLHAALYPLVRG